MDNNEFEDILNIRSVPPKRSNLERRIIQASLDVQSDMHTRSNRSIFAIIFDNILLPRPAMSMAVVLILGLSVGMYSVGGSDISYSDMDLLLSDVEMEYGEFL